MTFLSRRPRIHHGRPSEAAEGVMLRSCPSAHIIGGPNGAPLTALT